MCQYTVGMETSTIIADNWQRVVDMMPSDFERSAYDQAAIIRRREIRTAADLLHMIFLYCVCDLPIDQVALRLQELDICHLTGESVLERLRKSVDWLGYLVMRFLQERGLGQGTPGLHVRVVDASTISVPGSTGTDWRLHMGVDLESSRITSVELTGPEGGETLVRHEAEPGLVFLVDRGYSHRRGVATVMDKSADVVVRLNWQNFPLEDLNGNPLDPVERAEGLKPKEIGDFDVQFHYCRRVYHARLVIAPIPDEAAEEAERKATKAASKKHHRVSPNTLRAAHFTFILTTLDKDTISAQEVMALYRMRWQIELSFKRLKGILNLDHLRAKNVQTAKAYLLGKILAALVIDEIEHEGLSFFPSGRGSLRPADLAVVPAGVGR